MEKNSETVRDVCANCEVFDAYERFKAAKDAEIARLKEEKKCDWNSNRCGGGCLVWDDNVKMSKRIALLERALKPVMECETLDCNQNEHDDMPSFSAIVRCHNAVREAQRIMKESYNGESHN